MGASAAHLPYGVGLGHFPVESARSFLYLNDNISLVTAVRALPVASKPFEFQNTTHTVVFILDETLPCLLVKWVFHHISLLSCILRLGCQALSLVRYCLEFLLSLVGLYPLVCPHARQLLIVDQKLTSCRKRIPNSRNRSTINESPVARAIRSLYRWPHRSAGELSNVHSLP